MTAQAALVDRVRGLLAAEPVVREVSMFGGRAFLVNEKLVVSALRGGELLVRVAADDHDRLLERPGATQAEMGTGRTMGPGWIEVGAQSLDDDALAFWVGIAMAYNKSVTGGH